MVLSSFSDIRGIVNTAVAVSKGEHRRLAYLKDAIPFLSLSESEQRQLQLDKLREVLTYAGQRIPYWRDLFSSRQFNPSHVRSLTDLEQLPVLTKDTIRTHSAQLISEEFDRSSLIERNTGGTTGTPLRFYIDKESYDRQFAIHYRGLHRLGIRRGDSEVRIWGYGHPHRLTNQFSWLTGKTYLDAFDASNDTMTAWHEMLRKQTPKYIYAYAGAAYQFARFLLEQNKSLPGVSYVCVTAEKCYPEMRDVIAKAFSTKVIDMYGAHETVRLASECPSGSMHLDLDAAVLEFVGDKNNPTAPKKILLTTLLNRAMPFFRYDLGDFGEPADAHCNCGEAAPLMKMNVGKEHQLFSFPDGKRVHTSLFTKALYPISEIAAFQIRRTGSIEIRLLIVPVAGKEAAAQKKADAAVSQWLQKLENKIDIRVDTVTDIPKTKAGKQPFIFSEI